GTSDIQRSQSRGGESGTQLISVNGQRSQDNNYSIDGVDNNFMHMNSPGGSPPMDAIQEFRVATNNSAEFGRSAGANVNIAIRSGTRDLHGSAYWYVRNDKFDANPWFNNRDGIDKTPFKQNQYGLAFGGPVLIPKLYNGRDKTFWFASWEGFRRRRASTLRLATPPAELRAGDFSGVASIFDPLTGQIDAAGRIVRQPFSGNQIPKNRMEPSMTYLIDLMMPLPNQPGLTRNFVRQESSRNDRDIFVARADHTISSKDNIFGRVLHQRVGEFNPNANPNMYGVNRFDVDTVAAGWNHIFSPTTVLEVKYSYHHPWNIPATFTTNTTRGEFMSKTGIRMFDPVALFDPLPQFAATGWYTAGGGGGNNVGDFNQQLVGNVSRLAGKHSLKAGINYTRRQYEQNASNPTSGNAEFWPDLTASDTVKGSGNSFASMLLGYPSYIRRGTGIADARGRQNAAETFFQDDWRITDRLTVNLGLRYEFHNAPYDANDRLGNLLVTRDPLTGKIEAQLMWAGINPLPDPATGAVNSPPRRLGYGRALKKSDFNNFAPRIGVAWQLTAKTVIRSGFGVFYNGTFMQELNDERKFWPYLPQQELSPNRGARPDLSIRDAGPSFASTQAVGGWPQDPNNRSPYSQQWNFFVQQQLMADMAIDVGYVGSATRKQVGYHGWNNALKPGPGPVDPRRLLAASGFTGNMDGGSNHFNSEYNAFQVKLTKRFSKGLQLLSNYTWGKGMDDQSSLAEGKYQDFLNARADWSRTSYDIKHAFKLGYVYDVPFGRGRAFGGDWTRFVDGVLGGWALEGIVQWQTGTSSNARTGVDRANVGKTQERPNALRNPNLPASQRTVDRWFDTSAFVMPEPFTFGNAGAYTIADDGRQVFDLSIAKKFRLIEGHTLEVRSEYFNFPNHPNFGGANTVLPQAAFGVVSSATAARQIQFALRYTF
ncbi:MAG: TonB-dependent receptor, partial [Bryobacterales bacterium]|nr:TonB-dependent receptor [Bryobacterales bacterium]